ncbi:MAG: hypothetical protein KJ922_00105 [Nanoarchaeota archaeon]|nr:hypothetical protein [Nanoarchaeota archaeon]
MQEFADMAVAEVEEFIDFEGQFVKQEHALKDRLQSWDYIIMHIDEGLPEGHPLHKLSLKMASKLVEISHLVEESELSELRIEAEEEHIKKKLASDLKHRDWRAVRQAVSLEKADETRVLRLQKHEIKKLHSLFAQLERMMRSSRLKEVFETGNHETEEERYFLHIYQYAHFYEQFFWHLWKKEAKLAAKI